MCLATRLAVAMSDRTIESFDFERDTATETTTLDHPHSP